MGKNYEDLIKEMAEEIKNKLGKDSTLFGEKIDFSNSDMILVSAYEMGRQEEIKKNIKNLEFLREINGLTYG